MDIVATGGRDRSHGTGDQDAALIEIVAGTGGIVVDGVGFWVAFGLVGEVVVADCEAVDGVVTLVTHVVAVDEADSGDIALGGQGEDVGRIEEEELAEVACGAGFLAEMVVADEEEGGVGVVDNVADDAAELVGDIDAADRKSVV